MCERGKRYCIVFQPSRRLGADTGKRGDLEIYQQQKATIGAREDTRQRETPLAKIVSR